MDPIDLDLPEKFTGFRPNQLEIAAKIAGSQRYAYMLDAPTGTGKSLIAATAQRISREKVLYCCSTKQLQDQLIADFPYARTLKGRRNYPCQKYPRMFPNITAEECTDTTEKPCALKDKCRYMIAKREALGSQLAVLNTAYYLTEANFVGAFSGYKFVVLDEFDTIESQLMSYVEVVIIRYQLDKLNIPPPKYKTKFDSWVEWANATIKVVHSELVELEEATSGSAWTTPDFNLLKRKNALERLYHKLRFFVNEVDKNWVWLPQSDRWTFKPIWVSRYAKSALWKHSKKILGMSATLLDPRQIRVNVGLADQQFEYVTLPSPFPKENRPVYYEPCASVTRKQKQEALPKLAIAIEKILEHYPNERILIHTVSYEVRDFLLKNIASKRLLTHATSNRGEILAKFKSSREPLVLLSPSMDRGVDLPEEECRVVVIAKMPFPNLGDPQVNKRVHASRDGANWYAHKTISSIVQMAGRAVRSEKDFAATYILDEQFERIYNERRGMFPEWFRQAVIM